MNAPALMQSGTYAVNPEPSGLPWRLWAEVGADEAEARGVYAPVYSLSYGPRGAVAIAPGDLRGTVLIPERCDGYSSWRACSPWPRHRAAGGRYLLP
jgi:hypothetical protein